MCTIQVFVLLVISICFYCWSKSILFIHSLYRLVCVYMQTPHMVHCMCVAFVFHTWRAFDIISYRPPHHFSRSLKYSIFQIMFVFGVHIIIYTRCLCFDMMISFWIIQKLTKQTKTHTHKTRCTMMMNAGRMEAGGWCLSIHMQFIYIMLI